MRKLIDHVLSWIFRNVKKSGIEVIRCVFFVCRQVKVKLRHQQLSVVRETKLKPTKSYQISDCWNVWTMVTKHWRFPHDNLTSFMQNEVMRGADQSSVSQWLINTTMEVNVSGFNFFSTFDSGNLASVEAIPAESHPLLGCPYVSSVEEIPAEKGSPLTTADYSFRIWTRPDCSGKIEKPANFQQI